MSPRLHIIMPVTRPKNVARIVHNYLVEQQPHPFELRWHLMVQGPEPDPKGYHKSNEGAAMCQSGWLWFPSDDSLQPENLFRRLGELIAKHEYARAIVFSEHRPGVCPYTGGAWPKDKPQWMLIADPANMRRCHVDCTQVFFHHSLKPYFNSNTPHNEADGAYIEGIYAERPDAFVFAPDDFVTFGSLDTC